MSVAAINSGSEYYEVIKSPNLVVVDFYATWCGPCKMIAPKIDSFVKTYPTVTFVKVNVDDVSDVSQNAEIKAMPTFILYKNGQEIARIVGANSKELEEAIRAHS